MGNLTTSQANNIWSPSGNSLAVFIDGVTGVLSLKDSNGNVQPLENQLLLSQLNRGLFSQTANSTPITATTSELTLIDGGVGTLSVPANGFNVGDSFSANMSGIMSAKNNDAITFRVKSGSVVLTSGTFTLPTVSSQVWNLTIDFTIRALGGAGVASIVSLGQLHVLKFASGSQEGFGFNTINSTTFDTTTSNTLSITAQWSSNSALNSIYTNIFVLNKTF